MKQQITDLAALGGVPEFNDTLHVGRPNTGDRAKLLERMNEVLDNKWFTNAGPMVRSLEQRLAEFLGVKHCIAICNGSVALEIAFRALELKGEVIVPSFTFVATAHALQWQEITPVFADIDPQTHLLDPVAVEKMITPRTTGIVGVHLWGRPCNTEELTRIARKHNLKLAFDAAHAFGVSHKGIMIGNFGDAEVFSFHATKFFNTFEGGAIATNNDALAEKIRLMKNFGFAGYDTVIYPGTNGKMNEMSAAMGLTGLDALDMFIATNKNNYNTYKEELSGVPGLQLAGYNERERANYQYIICELDEHTTGISRDAVVQLLHAEQVLARKYFFPGCHNMEPYRSHFPHAKLLLPHTERLVHRIFSLPTGTAVDKETIQRVCALLRFIIENGRDITAALQKNNKSGISAA